MRVARASLTILLMAIAWRSAGAAEPTARELISPDSALVVEIDRPFQLWDSQLSREVWELIRETHGIQQGLSSPGIEKFRQAALFVEKSLGVDWRTGIDRLTAGGIVIAVKPQKSGGEPVVTAVITAADEETLKKFIEAVQAEIRRSAGTRAAASGEGDKDSSGAQPPLEPRESNYRSFVCSHVGNGHFSRVGRRLMVSNSQEGLEGALDRQAGVDTTKPFVPPASLRLVDSLGKPPLLLVTVNLKLLKEDPKSTASLAISANDPAPIFLLGGYLDIIRRADFAAAGLFVSEAADELRIRVPVGIDGAGTGLRGFFASEPTESAPSLLRPAGTILTAGWFRDYRKLWDSRKEILNPDVVSRLEAANAKAQSEGAKIGAADLVQMVGPQFRFVAQRPRESVYPILLDERLPAFALVVSVRDETAFRQRMLTAIDSLLWLGVASGNLGEIRPSDYRGAKINTLRFAEKPEFADSERRVVYNFDPSYSLTRGQFIVGSNSETIRDLIDELDRQALAPEASGDSKGGVTDRLEWSFTELAEVLKDYAPHLVRGAVRNKGVNRAEAEKDVEALRQVLVRIASLVTTTQIAGDHFEFRVRLGTDGAKP